MIIRGLILILSTIMLLIGFLNVLTPEVNNFIAVLLLK